MVRTIRSLGLTLGLIALAIRPGFAQKESKAAKSLIERVGSTSLVAASGGVPGEYYRGLRPGSTLPLEWVTAFDSTLGLTFESVTGTEIDELTSPTLEAQYKLVALDSIVAFEVRTLTFDVWRNYTGVLVYRQVIDMGPKARRTFKKQWVLDNRWDVYGHQSSITYVARVRRANGTITVADPAPVLAAARRLVASVTVQDLEKQLTPTEADSAFMKRTET
jgi:hypothetical protein